jgi:prepilin signal peptidase PulO-like enzyme (type II secretory pathway)
MIDRPTIITGAQSLAVAEPKPPGRACPPPDTVVQHARPANPSTVEHAAMTATTVASRAAVTAPKRAVGIMATAGGAAAWWGSGHAVAVTLTVLAIIVVLAAIVDARVSRLPNRASAAASLVVVASIPFVAVFDNRSVADTALSALAGMVYSGAPLLFAIWLVRPRAIGGGDWKMLGAIGAGIGLALPFAALVMTTIACLIQIAASTIRQQKVMAFGPSIAAGYAAALLLLPFLVHTLGGPYV